MPTRPRLAWWVETPDTGRAAQIFDALAQVKGAAIGSPTFHLSEEKRQAMRDELVALFALGLQLGKRQAGVHRSEVTTSVRF